jgi:hypothetical protein
MNDQPIDQSPESIANTPDTTLNEIPADTFMVSSPETDRGDDKVVHDESISAVPARINRLLAKPTFLLLATTIAAALLVLVVLSLGGTGDPPDTESTAVIKIRILNDAESIFGKAELYLKVESSLYPDYAVLYPINVGKTSGQKSKILRTPFLHQGKTDEIFIFEILDEDDFSSEEEEAIQGIVESGANLLWHGGQLYAMTNGVVLPPAAQSDFVKISTLTSSLILESLAQHAFDSCGIAVYKSFPNPKINLRDANTLTVIDEDDDAIAEIHVYYPSTVEK